MAPEGVHTFFEQVELEAQTSQRKLHQAERLHRDETRRTYDDIIQVIENMNTTQCLAYLDNFDMLYILLFDMLYTLIEFFISYLF